ncbi:MAG: TIGR01777 family oxidoreductase [Flavobacteriaceae bacterium]
MKVLITGATGLIGRKLIALLVSKNIDVNYLTTRKSELNKIPKCKGFYWNPKNVEIDENCIIGVDKIIHLAGASVSKRWTASYKKDIISSRVLPTQTLFKLLKTSKHQVTHLVSASAIGVYKSSFTTLYNEKSLEFGTDFLANVVQLWEKEVDRFSELNIQISKLRIGVVLSEKDGALSELIKPINLCAGAPIASGKQFVSWIHINDLAEVFSYIISNNLYGVYNAVAPKPVTNKTLTVAIAKQLNKPLFLPNIPKVIMKLTLGEMHKLICESQKVSSKKIQNAGFHFQYENLNLALASLLS